MDRFSILLVIIVFLLGVFNQQAFGQSSVGTRAMVGDFTLHLSGFASPHARLILRSSDMLLATALGDSEGNFSFGTIIRKGFSQFCIVATDTKQLGKSTICYSFPKAEQSIEIGDIFLAPTISLSQQEIQPGKSVHVSGYTMPSALVMLHVSNRRDIEAAADLNGFYDFELKDLPEGTYQLSTQSRYQGKNTQVFSAIVELKVVSSAKDSVNRIKKLFQNTSQTLINSVEKTGMPRWIWIGIGVGLIMGGMVFFFIWKSKKQ